MSNDKRTDRDGELDRLLTPLRDATPHPDQLQAWKKAATGTRGPKRPHWRGFRLIALPQLAAALVLGILIGGILSSAGKRPVGDLAEKAEPSATIERIYSKAS